MSVNKKEGFTLIEKIKQYRFLFSELVKRDFKKKYKRTVLGVLWSLLAPLLHVLVLMLVFVKFFGRTQDHFIIYLFSGTLIMSMFTESTQGCMRSLMQNASILTKINVPKYLFLMSKTFQSFINFMLTMIIFFVFCIFDKIQFGFHMLTLVYPIITFTVFCFGVGMILSAMFVFFRDIEYLYGVFLTILNYVSAIFYPIDLFGKYQFLFHANPVYVYIDYFRTVLIDVEIPSLALHGLCAFYALVVCLIGYWIYKKCDHEFLYYL